MTTTIDSTTARIPGTAIQISICIAVPGMHMLDALDQEMILGPPRANYPNTDNFEWIIISILDQNFLHIKRTELSRKWKIERPHAEQVFCLAHIIPARPWTRSTRAN